MKPDAQRLADVAADFLKEWDSHGGARSHAEADAAADLHGVLESVAGHLLSWVPGEPGRVALRVAGPGSMPDRIGSDSSAGGGSGE